MHILAPSEMKERLEKAKYVSREKKDGKWVYRYYIKKGGKRGRKPKTERDTGSKGIKDTNISSKGSYTLHPNEKKFTIPHFEYITNSYVTATVEGQPIHLKDSTGKELNNLVLVSRAGSKRDNTTYAVMDPETGRYLHYETDDKHLKPKHSFSLFDSRELAIRAALSVPFDNVLERRKLMKKHMRETEKANQDKKDREDKIEARQTEVENMSEGDFDLSNTKSEHFITFENPSSSSSGVVHVSGVSGYTANVMDGKRKISVFVYNHKQIKYGSEWKVIEVSSGMLMGPGAKSKVSALRIAQSNVDKLIDRQGVGSMSKRIKDNIAVNERRGIEDMKLEDYKKQREGV